MLNFPEILSSASTIEDLFLKYRGLADINIIISSQLFCQANLGQKLLITSCNYGFHWADADIGEKDSFRSGTK